MHYGTCVTHVPWCMPGSLTSGFLWNWRRGETFPAFPAHAQPACSKSAGIYVSRTKIQPAPTKSQANTIQQTTTEHDKARSWGLYFVLLLNDNQCLSPYQFWLNNECKAADQNHIDGLVQDRWNSIANTLELLQSCTKPSIWIWMESWRRGFEAGFAGI